MLIATSNTIQIEDTIQPPTNNIEIVTTRIKTSPPITVGAAYVPPSAKITQTDLDQITNKLPTQFYLIGGDFNAKHQQWNNTKRNNNGTAIKKHAEAERYQVTHSPTFTHRQPNCRPSNIDIFLSNLPYPHHITTLDTLSFNHLPVKLTIELTSINRKNKLIKHTNWDRFRNICNTHTIHRLNTPE